MQAVNISIIRRKMIQATLHMCHMTGNKRKKTYLHDHYKAMGFPEVRKSISWLKNKSCQGVNFFITITPTATSDDKSDINVTVVFQWRRNSWWRHQIETFSTLLAICAGNSPVPGKFPTQRPVTRSFDVYIDLRPNKRLSKHSWGWWYETPSRPLWRHRNVESNTQCQEITSWSTCVAHWHQGPTCISNYIHYNVCDQTTSHFPDFNGVAIEVWEWVNNLLSSILYWHVITYKCWD